MRKFVLGVLAAFFVAGAVASGAEVPLQAWDLPTGSHLAVVHFGNGRNPVPVIYLHGGPGADFVSSVREHPDWWQRLSARGADIYVYDQIGSGLSARLRDPTQYTSGAMSQISTLSAAGSRQSISS
jgi:hypothetical protein